MHFHVMPAKTMADILPGVLRDLQSPAKKDAGRITEKWDSIAGPRVAPHTRPFLTKNGNVIVWVDRSALAFELSQRFRSSLLKRIQAVLGEEKVKAIYFKVGQIR